jgi:uncharacterized RDD family membrane protein YckC
MTDPQTPPPASEQPPRTNWQAAPPATPVPGAAGFVYADVPNRVIALIIDAIIVGIITFIVNGVLYGIIGQPVKILFDPNSLNDLNNLNNLSIGTSVNYVSLVIGAIVGLAIGAAYYIYTWTAMRATIGQRMLGMQVGNYPDGRSLTQEQAIRRWLFLFAPLSLGQVIYVLPTLGALLGLLSFLYAIYLLYTTAQSPTKQGFHDKQANTVVVKAARTV